MLLRALWLRPTRRRPLRAAVTVLGVAIGVAAVVSTLLASRAAVASLGSDVERIAGAARLEVTRPGGVALEDLARLAPLADEALLAPVVEGAALAPELGDLVRILGVDLLVDGAVRQVGLGGLEPGAEDAGGGGPPVAFDTMLLGRGAAIGAGLARTLGLSVGDELELVVQAKRVRLEVAALLTPETFASAWDRVVLVDLALAQELYGRLDRVDRVELVPRTGHGDDGSDREPSAEVEAALAARAAALLPTGYRVGPASERRAEGERMVRALEFNLTALAGVSVLVGVVLVATTLATSVVQRRAWIALLRSLGASRRQLARALVTEAAAIGLAGGLLGVLLGWLGARVAVTGVSATVATVVEGAVAGAVELEPAWVVLGVGLGLVASVAAAILPLREALRTPPVQGLRSVRAESVAARPWRARAAGFAALVAAAVLFLNLPPLGDRPVWALCAALAILGTMFVLSGPLVDLFAGLHPSLVRHRAAVPLRLAQAALEAGRSRAAWAAAAIGVAVGLAVSMTTMVGSFRTSVIAWTEQAMPSDLFLRPLATDAGALAGRIDPEVVRVARAVLGAANVDPFHQDAAYLDGERVLLAGAAFGVVAREGGVPFLDGRPSHEVFAAALAEGGVVVNEPFSRRTGLERGDELELATPAGPLVAPITGVYRDYSGHTGRVVMDLGPYLERYPDEGPQSIATFVPPDGPFGGDVPAARAALADALEGRFAVELLDNRELRAEVLFVFERTFAITIALQAISAVVAAIAVVAVLTALVHERRRELAVVRVLGGSRRQLVSLVLGEALLLGLAGTTGGLLVGLAVGWVLVAVVNLQSFGWTLAFHAPSSLWLTLVVVVPACLLAGLAPAVIALRTPPRESLRAAD